MSHQNEARSINCPVCGAHSVDPVFGARDADTGHIEFHLARCQQCALIRLDPMPSNRMLETYYGMGYYGQGESKFLPLAEIAVQALNMIRARKMLRWLGRVRSSENIRPRILDIGCGRGGLLTAFARNSCECHGLERANYEGNISKGNYTLHLGEIDAANLEKGSYDLVVIWHVLEHLPEPSRTLEQVFNLLRGNGLLVLAVPNISSRQARWFKQFWFHLDLPRHVWHFTPKNLNELCQSIGFHPVRSSGICIEQNVYGFIQSALNRMFAGSPNGLYHLIQGSGGGDVKETVFWGLSSILLAPFALIECLLSASARKGATTVQCWVKR